MNKRKLGAAVLLLALGLGPVQTSQNYNLKLNNLAYAQDTGEESLEEQVENHYNEITSRKVYKIATDEEISDLNHSYGLAKQNISELSAAPDNTSWIDRFLDSDFESLGSSVVSNMDSRTSVRKEVATLENVKDKVKLDEADLNLINNNINVMQEYVSDRNSRDYRLSKEPNNSLVEKLARKYDFDIDSVQPSEKQLSEIEYKGGYPDDVPEEVLSMDTSVEEYILMANPLIIEADSFLNSEYILEHDSDLVKKYSQAKDELESAVETKSENIGSAIENIKTVRKELGLDGASDVPPEPDEPENPVSKEDIEESKKNVGENKKNLSSILKVIDNSYLSNGKEGENLAEIFNKASDNLESVLSSDEINPSEFLKAIENYKKAFENITKYIDNNYSNKSVKELKEYAEKKKKEADGLFTEENLKKVSNDDKAYIDNYKQNKEKLEKLLKEENVDKDKLVSAIIDFEASTIDLKKAISGDIDKKHNELVKEYEEVKKSDTYKDASEGKKKAYDDALKEFKDKKYKTEEELEAAKAKMEEAKNALSVKVTTEEEKEIESVIEKHGDFIKSDEYLRATAELQKAYDDAYDAIKADKTKENLDKVKKAKTDISDYYSKFNAEIESLEKYIDQAKTDSLTEDSLKKLKKEYKEKLEEIKSDNSKTIDDIKELKEEFDAKLNPKEPEKDSPKAKEDAKKTTKKVVTSSKKSNGKVRTGVDAILPVVGGVAIVAAIGLIFTRRKNK